MKKFVYASLILFCGVNPNINCYGASASGTAQKIGNMTYYNFHSYPSPAKSFQQGMMQGAYLGSVISQNRAVEAQIGNYQSAENWRDWYATIDLLDLKEKTFVKKLMLMPLGNIYTLISNSNVETGYKIETLLTPLKRKKLSVWIANSWNSLEKEELAKNYISASHEKRIAIMNILTYSNRTKLKASYKKWLNKEDIEIVLKHLQGMSPKQSRVTLKGISIESTRSKELREKGFNWRKYRQKNSKKSKY